MYSDWALPASMTVAFYTTEISEHFSGADPQKENYGNQQKNVIAFNSISANVSKS